jgi:hypothetical protein
MSVPWQELLGLMQQLLGEAATKDQLNQLLDDTTWIKNELTSLDKQIFNATYGLQAAHSERLDIRNDINDAQSAIEDAITASQGVITDAVGSPAQDGTPPIWYTSPPDVGSFPSAVWDVVYSLGETTGSQLGRLESMGDEIRQKAGLPWNLDPNFAVIGPWKPPAGD